MALSLLEFLMALTQPDFLRIVIDVGILVLVILCFCSALYLVTEIKVPDSTIEQCHKLNDIAHLEWIFNLILGTAFVFCRYFVCGFLTFPIGMYHFFRYTQHGSEIFDPMSIHRKHLRDRHIQYYGAKLFFFTILFLTVMVYLGFGILDFFLQFDWETTLGVGFNPNHLSPPIKA